MNGSRIACLSVILAVGGVAACNDANGPGTARSVSLSFMTATPGTLTNNRASMTGADAVIGVGQDTLVISQAQVVFADIELRGARGVACPAADSNEDVGGDNGHDVMNRSDGDNDNDQAERCEELDVSPMIVDLPVDSAVVSQLHVGIPAGTYTKLEAKLDPARQGDDSAAAFLSAHPDFAGISVRVSGTFDGHAFVYTGAPKAHLEFRFHPPITVDQTGANVTVRVDLSQWFRDQAGALIDPATAAAGGPNAALVAANIGQSFHAFRDDRREGHDDGGHGDDGMGPGSNGGDGNGGH
jgi:hypothetical protein